MKKPSNQKMGKWRLLKQSKKPQTPNSVARNFLLLKFGVEILQKKGGRKGLPGRGLGHTWRVGGLSKKLGIL